MKITHLDSHQHLHLLPGIAGVVAEIGQKTGIRRIRIPGEVIMPGVRSASPLRRWQGRMIFRLAAKRRREFQNAGFACPDHFIGFERGGNFNLDNWLALIPRLREGVTEVMVHPGVDSGALQSATHWGYHWEEELAALINPQVRVSLEKHGIQLINYGNLD